MSKDRLFVGRKKELALLEGLLKEGKTKGVFVTGRRGIGKSRLIEEFVKGKKRKGLFVQEGPLEASLQEQIALRSQQESSFFFCIESVEPSWIHPSLLQLPHTILKLEELSFPEVAALLPSLSKQEKLERLIQGGGVPLHLLYPKREKSALQECLSLVSKRRKGVHEQIVKALSKGPLGYLELVSTANYTSSGAFSGYLEELIDLHLLERDFTWDLKTGEKALKLSKYRLKDNACLMEISPSAKHLALHNLLLQNRFSLFQALGIRKEDVVFEGPYFQNETKKEKSSELDYLIQTRQGIFYAFKVDTEQMDCAKRMKEQIENLSLPKGSVCLPILVHAEKEPFQEDPSGFFFKKIGF
jgi:predicted AAA+ superfamily ATPase